jgi:hypothetical protein
MVGAACIAWVFRKTVTVGLGAKRSNHSAPGSALAAMPVDTSALTHTAHSQGGHDLVRAEAITGVKRQKRRAGL